MDLKISKTVFLELGFLIPISGPKLVLISRVEVTRDREYFTGYDSLPAIVGNIWVRI